jgi:hypothetical protein
MKDRDQKDLELFEPFKHDFKKKICLGTARHRTLQDRPEEVAAQVRKALKYIPPERLERLWLWASGLQPRDLFLQGECDRTRLQYHASRIGAACDLRAGRRS